MFEYTKQYFINKGLTLTDIPKAAIIHETLGLTILLTFWSCCYIARPSHHLLIPLQRKYPELISSIAKKLDFSFLKYKEKFKKVEKLKKNSERAIISLCESIILRNLLRPVTIPIKLYFTWRIILFLNETSQNP